MKRHLSTILMLLLALTLLVGCGSSYEKEDSMTATSTTESKADYGYAEEAPMDYDAEFQGASAMEDAVQNGEAMDEGGTFTDADLQGKADNRKYILSFRYYLETLDFEKTVSELEQMVSLHFGFFESSESEGGGYNTSYYRRSASYKIRIPKEKVDAFTKGLEGIGNIVNKSSFTEDVTGQYYDMEARIKTLKIQEERLLAILEQANDLEYIIQLERELSDVRYQIESYSSSFRYLQDQINYSTVYVDLQEVKEPTVYEEEPDTFFQKMGKGFMDSIEGVISFFGNLILFLTTNSPVLVLLGLFGFIAFKVLRRLIRRKKAPKSNVEGLKKEE